MKFPILSFLAVVAGLSIACIGKREVPVTISWTLTHQGQPLGCGSAGNIEAVGVYRRTNEGEEIQVAQFPCYQGRGTISLPPGAYALEVSALECDDTFGTGLCASDGNTTIAVDLSGESTADPIEVEIPLDDIE